MLHDGRAWRSVLTFSDLCGGFLGTVRLLLFKGGLKPNNAASQYTGKGREPSATASQIEKIKIGVVASFAGVSHTNCSMSGVNKTLTP